MPHESTVNPEEPMHFKSWGDETSASSGPLDSRRSATDQVTTSTPRFDRSTSIQTHPDLPLHVTHDHDNDGDLDEDESFTADQDLELDLRSRITYTPPKRNNAPNNK